MIATTAKNILIRDIPNGSIVWKGFKVVGIKGATLDKKWYDYECTKVPGNEFDWEIIIKKK